MSEILTASKAFLEQTKVDVKKAKEISSSELRVLQNHIKKSCQSVESTISNDIHRITKNNQKLFDSIKEENQQISQSLKVKQLKTSMIFLLGTIFGMTLTVLILLVFWKYIINDPNMLREMISLIKTLRD